MKMKGRGEPPAGFEVIVMGSGGRGENFLYPDEDRTRIDGFFIELAKRLTRDLSGIDFPLCRGHVMAVNPLCRKTLPQWIGQSTGWFAKRTAFAAQFSNIFFDFQPAYGEGGLSRSPRRHVARLTRERPVVLKEMFSAEADRRVALGLFDRPTRG